MLLAGAFGLAATGAANAESVMKQCGDEWKAPRPPARPTARPGRNSSRPAGAEGRRGPRRGARSSAGRRARAAPAAAPRRCAPAPAAAAPAPMKPTPMKPAPKPAAAATGAGEFTTEAEAKAHCPSDTVVWVNTKSHKYHFAGHKSYGTTKQGAYMCEADAKAAGDVAAKGEKAE